MKVCISEQSSLVTSSEAEDGSELDAYISGGANLFGLLSATVTGSLKLLDKDKGIMNIFLHNKLFLVMLILIFAGEGRLGQVCSELQSQD